VTFTNAAASEMRERILEAIYKKLEEDNENVRLQRQITLLGKASICTIHSFCLEVIRNHFYEIDISANFRIGDTAEVELLKHEVLDELFEQKYFEEDKNFLKLIETYTGYRDDEKLAEFILDIYKYIQSSPFPLKWLEDKVEMFYINDQIDFSDTIWGNIILSEIKDKIRECIARLENIRNNTLRFYELEKYSMVLENDIKNLSYILDNSLSWDKAYKNMQELEWKKWPIDKKVTIELKNEAKEARDKVKKEIAGISIKYDSKEAIEDINTMYEILKALEQMIKEFANQFANKKKERNIIDFNDIEHFALNILLREEEDGSIQETEVAKEYKLKFEEIAIDEYQDSNLVQEYILNSISNKNNIFMVGDVKQSIYKFRQAMPELFLDKYAKYQQKEKYEVGNGLKIQLFKNFRSRQNILDLTNLVFENIMSKYLGDVEYNKEEFLNYGANYLQLEESEALGIAELDVINLKEDETNIYKNEDEAVIENQEDNEERIEDCVLEAKFVANKIKELIQSNYMVYDKKRGYRKITYKDICVLLRATSKLAPIYETEIAKLNLPVFSDSSGTYLDSMEVQTIMALLKCINNPMQDIPFVTVLRSEIGGFNDNELIEIRLADKEKSFYEAILKARMIVREELKGKIEELLEKLEKWRKEEKYLPLDEFIWKLYIDTGFYHYVSLLQNGNIRQANLKLLFEKAKQFEKASFKGLFNFVNFIDKVRISSNDMGAAKLIGENDNVIRIMSIHKSKGLEFPVVFLSGTGKKFNMQDLNKPIILHQDIGFGIKYIDSERRIEYDTLTKEAIRLKSRRETISEEMRVLYVALTRAKEKLIITGITKDLSKDFKQKEKLLDIYTEKCNKINSRVVEKYISYLDWLQLVYLYNKDKISNILELHEYKKGDILKDVKVAEEKQPHIEEVLRNELENVDDEEKKNIEANIKNILGWRYEFIDSSKIPTKTSVTKIKQFENTEVVLDFEQLLNKKENNIEASITYIPEFAKKEKKLTPMQKGTLLHLCVQKLDEKSINTKQDLIGFIKGLYDKNIITELELNSINVDILTRYIESDLYKQLKKAKQIKKEVPFYINIPANMMYQNTDETILVQGIIDLYYIDEDDNLILIDYKTDKVIAGEEYTLEEKYKVQLEIYKKALEEALGKEVNKAMIYSLS